MADNDRLAAALAYQGATAAPPTMAQQLAKVPSRLIGALKALGTGSSYGSAEPVNAVNDLAKTRFWRGSVFGVPEDVQERNQARAMEAASMAAPIVYHGTPHRFAATAKNPLGEFDPTKIGTGEGAQAYGYGHYVAEQPAVAKDYQKTLSGKTDFGEQPSDSAFVHAIMSFKEAGYPVEQIPAEMKKAYKGITDKDIKLALQASNQGALYKIDLPDEAVSRMLDWDKPFSQQNPEVKKMLQDAAILGKDDWLISGMRGREIYNRSKFGAPVKLPLRQVDDAIYASERLRQAGIPGIQYLDKGSRGAGTGTRNFVVFPGNEGLLNILGRE